MGAFKDIYDILKDLLQVAKDAGNQVLVDKAMDIQAKLFEFKEENEGLKDEIKSLREQIAAYDKTAEIEAALIPHTGAFYTTKDDPQKRIFCSHCWQSGKKLIQMHSFNGPFHLCPHCKNTFEIREWKNI